MADLGALDQRQVLTDFLNWLCRLSASLSVAKWIGAEEPKRQGRLQLYVLGWLAVLVVLLAVPLPGVLVAVVAGYRLQDLVLASIDDAVDPKSKFRRFGAEGRIAILLVNIVQIVLIFALLDLALVGKAALTLPIVFHNNLDYVFQSWNSLPPLGSATPGPSMAAYVLSVLETGSGLLVLVVALSAFLSKVTASPSPEQFPVNSTAAVHRVGQRVLVHDPDPPHRLWEGRLTEAKADRWDVAIPDRSGSQVVTVGPERLHPLPMTWSGDCPLCQSP